MSMEHLGRIVALMAASPIHRDWSVADIERLIVPPIVARQSVSIEEGGKLVAWGSWACLTEEAEEAFQTGRRKLTARDWTAGDRCWLIDAIAPYGHARRLCRMIRQGMKAQGFDTVRFRRITDGKRRYSGVAL